MSILINLLTISGWNPNKSGGAGLDTRYFGTHGFTSGPGDLPPNTWYEPRLSNPGLYSQSMYAPGTTGGASSGGFGVAELLNTDGGLDELVDWGFDGNPCVISEGPLTGALSDFGTVTFGTVEQVEHSWRKITLRYKDRTVELDRPVALSYYTGSNVLPAGLEGVADLAGKPKPRLFGSVRNFTPVMVNTSKLVYQANDGPLAGITAVRDNGVALTAGTAHASSALLLAATPAPGSFDYCLSEGYLRLGSALVGQLTMDAAAPTLSIGQTVRVLAVEKLGTSKIIEQSMIDLDKVLPPSVLFGYYTGLNATTTKEVFDDLSRAGIWWGFDNNGRFWAKQFSAPPASNPIYTLTMDNLLSVERSATEDSDRGVPVWKVVCRYARNHTVQTALAGSVAVGAYHQEWLEAVYQDPADGSAAGIRTVHPLAVELVIETPFTNYADALAEATRQFALRSVRRDRLTVQLTMGAVQYPAGGYWDDEAITELPTPRYQTAACVHGSYLYVIGGSSSGEAPSNVRLDLSNPSAAWDAAGVTDLPAIRSRHTATVYGNWLYVAGGLVADSQSASVIRLDLSNPAGAWDDAGVTNLPATRFDHQSVVYGSFLYVLGGYVDGNRSTSVIRLDLSNPAGAWDDTGVTDLATAVSGHQAVVYANWLYVVGGTSPGPYLATVTRLNLSSPTGAWDDAGVTNLPAASTGHLCLVSDGWLYLLGGLNGSGQYLRSVLRLNLAQPAGAWLTDPAALPDAQVSMSGAVYGSSLYTAGGYLAGNAESHTWVLRTNQNPQDRSELTGLGRTTLVTLPRYGYASGRQMKIIGSESDHANRKINLELWG